MERAPYAVFVVDLNAEHIVVKEAARLNIPVIALVDSNCDPTDIEFVIPGNDDAIRSASLVANAIAAACVEGRELARVQAKDTPTAEEAEAEAAEKVKSSSKPESAPEVTEEATEEPGVTEAEVATAPESGAE